MCMAPQDTQFKAARIGPQEPMTSYRLVMTLYAWSTYQKIEVTESPMSKQQCLQLICS